MYDINALNSAQTNNKCSGQTYKSSSLTEYKLSIYKQINDMISKSTNNEDMIWVDISDEGFENMKQNPAYEAWVLDKVRQACNSCKHYGYASWFSLKFGANESDYKEMGHSFPNRKMREMQRKRELEEKKEIQKKRKKQLEKKLLEKLWRKQKTEQIYTQLKILDHRIQVQKENKAIFEGKEFYPQDHSASLYATAKRRAAAYETFFIFRDKA